MPDKYVLYIDDSGSRDPDRADFTGRSDDMDCFALGGYLLKEEDIPHLRRKHADFCEQWKITYPLHSSSLRGGRGNFAWLKKPENAGLFMPALQEYLLSLPLLGIACVIHRPGYVARYKNTYRESLWYMCKTAFTILVERSAKYADEQGRKLEIVFEGTGKREDRDIKRYLKELKTIGNPFNQQSSQGYRPLSPADFTRIILGEPHQKTKDIPMLQVADLILYPIAKAGYDRSYRPYVKLKEERKLIDCWLSDDQIQFRGIKYSCFDGAKKEKRPG
ncbi:MAG: DUF3800 domain-containing protein [Nitrospira sp.]|nr:DUF3800 domain-containing protein [Nitrospira sp.]